MRPGKRLWSFYYYNSATNFPSRYIVVWISQRFCPTVQYKFFIIVRKIKDCRKYLLVKRFTLSVEIRKKNQTRTHDCVKFCTSEWKCIQYTYFEVAGHKIAVIAGIRFCYGWREQIAICTNFIRQMYIGHISHHKDTYCYHSIRKQNSGRYEFH